MSRRAPTKLAGLVIVALTAGCGLSSQAVSSLQQQAASGGTTTGSGSGVTGSGGGTADLGGTGTTIAGGGTGPSAGVGGGTSSTSTTVGGGGTSTGSGGQSGSGAAGSGSGSGSAVGSGSAGGGSRSAAKYETVGISAKQITLGLHAPQTGAAPVPLQAFQTGTKLFWENHKVFGRKVVVNFFDDQYNPSVARQRCEQLSRSSFLVIGGAGTDQIQACATDPVLQATHTPYVSVGVTTNGLTSLPYYFAVTQTYASQVPEVWTMANELFPANAKGKWAVVTEDTPNFTDVTNAAVALLKQHHIAYKVIRTPKAGSAGQAAAVVNQAEAFTGRSGGSVFLDVDPNFWIDMIAAAAQSLYSPAWVGPGVTQGEDLVAGPVCGAQTYIKAAFLSPFMGLDREPKGFTQQNNPKPDGLKTNRDVELLLYGVNEMLYHALLSVGSINNLTRDNFINAMTHFSAKLGAQLSVLPTVNFNGGHFGSTGSWIEKLSCSKLEYTTVGSGPISH
ncbi:MAG TPA: ABC transporter substrate-binding protein [Mycobacteriales bacterium]|nr:ABC transporter substrate-binding protein [Mycobacteriales bacterium]